MAHQTTHPHGERLWKDELVHIERDRSDYHVSPGYRPEINTLTMDRPAIWLRKGWHDLRRNPVKSIGYGAVIALFYGVIVAFALATQLYHVGIQLTAGFILLAPLLAVGFYVISQKMEKNEPVRFNDAFSALRHNHKSLLGMGLMMVLLFLAWFMVSMWAAAFLAESKEELALFLGAENFPEFFGTLVTSLSLPMVLGYFLIGLVTVMIAFAFTAVSIPMLMDRPETDAITALTISWEAVIHNWKPMLLWAVMIAFFTGVGIAFFYIGLAVTMPLLGFATWHAYRDTLGKWRKVEESQAPYY